MEHDIRSQGYEGMSFKEIDPYGVIDFAEWQNILNILSTMSGAKSATITKIDFPNIDVIKISATPGFPLYEGMGTKLMNHYCEEVFTSQKKILVTNALREEKWKNAPEISHGLVSYLGYPLFLPSGEMFGTLCIHNDQETAYSQEIDNLMHQFKKVIEAHFALAEQTKQLKESEETLRSSEARFRALIENSPDAIFVKTQGRFAYLNYAALRLFGAQDERELVGKPFIKFCHPGFHEIVQERMFKIDTERKELPRLEQVFLRLDGTMIDAEVSAVPIDYDGRSGALVFARDISERKQLEQLKEDIDKITRHDLKTPLNGIIGLPQALLADDNLNDKQKRLLRHIEVSGLRMMNIIDMSLTLYQIEKGEYHLDPSPVDLVPIIRDIEHDLSDLFKSVNSRLSITIYSEQDSIDSFFVSGEKSLCYTMLSNLIKNAVENVQYGEEIPVSLEETEPAQAKVSIHNSGMIPESIQAHLGQKYNTLSKNSGTGLGVYSARLIANAMNGRFDWSSSSASGTSVSIELPKTTG